MVRTKFLIFNILFLFLLNCKNKEPQKPLDLNINLMCHKVIKNKDGNSVSIIFKIETKNNTNYNVFFQSYSSKSVTDSIKNNGFFLKNKIDENRINLFSTDDDFTMIPPLSESHFYLKTNLSVLNFSDSLINELKKYDLRYNGEIKFIEINNRKEVSLNTNFNSIPFENLILREVNYKNLLFEKDLDTIQF